MSRGRGSMQTYGWRRCFANPFHMSVPRWGLCPQRNHTQSMLTGWRRIWHRCQVHMFVVCADAVLTRGEMVRWETGEGSSVYFPAVLICISLIATYGDIVAEKQASWTITVVYSVLLMWIFIGGSSCCAVNIHKAFLYSFGTSINSSGEFVVQC